MKFLPEDDDIRAIVAVWLGFCAFAVVGVIVTGVVEILK